ncbi:RNA polymerase sigma factor [Kineococcus sp. SYSU DK006]|uniref:RNA polymerase sigma factor n=1 Tax=Kineococcus sp. SYSU DK006 TaxID=3383127 RepID=UPI003D7CF2B5
MPAADAAAPVAATLARVVAADHARIVAAVIATVGDWQVAEDALQDACERALTSWAHDGLPANPAGWLVTTARRRGIDLLRRAAGRESTAQRYGSALERGLLAPDDGGDGDDGGGGPGIGDDRLRLVLTCAHPALPLQARVALTLRTVLGWTPAEIARSLLSTEAAIDKRLVRARAKIAHAGIPYRLPSPQDLPGRIDGVLAVVHLLFTTGYADAGRAELMAEAVRLGRLVRDLLEPAAPERCEASGLLALMLAQRSRQRARFDADGEPVLMDRQDRSLWDRDAVAEARHLLDEVLQHAAHRRRPVGRYVLQAAIALEHAQPREAGDTDWVRIAELHRLLDRVAGSPAQRIAWAVAAGRAHGPLRGLEVLDGVRRGEGLHLFHAARADLLEAAGQLAEAERAYARAAGLAPGAGERAALSARQRALADRCTRTAPTTRP